MYKKEIIITCKTFVLFLVFLLFVGCAGSVINKGCNTLTDVYEKVDKIYLQAKTIHESDPNIVSLKDLDVVYNVLDTINTAKDITCAAKDISILNKK